MFGRDRHLNIFEHYQGLDTLPIENNISRGFAIVLEAYPLVFDRFLDYVNSKCAEKRADIAVSKPENFDDFDIGFQQSIAQIADAYSEASLIIGLTLTTVAAEEGSETSKEANPNLITDIAVAIGDAIIVVEVKRTNENAFNQCQHQVDSLEAKLCDDNKDADIATILLDGTWEEGIELLQQSGSLLQECPQGILSQYLEHLNYRYQQWFPVKKLSEVNFLEESNSLIEKRLYTVAQNCCENPDEAKKQWEGYSMPTGRPCARFALIAPNYNKRSLQIKLWIADTKGQGQRYFQICSDDLSWIYEENICMGNRDFKIDVVPYVRFAHFNRTIFQAYLLDSYYTEFFGTSKDKWLTFWKDISHKWWRDDWKSLVKLLKERYAGSIADEEVDSEFKRYFLDSKRTYVDVSLGYEVTASIPHDVLVEKERASAIQPKESDKLAALVKDIVEKMLHCVR